MSKTVVRIAAVALLLCSSAAHAAHITAPDAAARPQPHSGHDYAQHIALFAGMPTPPAECAALEKAPTCEQMQECLSVLPAFCKTVPAQFTAVCDTGLKQLQGAVVQVCKAADDAVIDDSTGYVGDLSFFDAHRPFFGAVVPTECLELANSPSCEEMHTCITALPGCGDYGEDWECHEGVRHLMNVASRLCDPDSTDNFDDEPTEAQMVAEMDAAHPHPEPNAPTDEEHTAAAHAAHLAENPEYDEAKEAADLKEYEAMMAEMGTEDESPAGGEQEGGAVDPDSEPEGEVLEDDFDLSSYTEDPDTPGVFYPPEQVEQAQPAGVEEDDVEENFLPIE